MKFVNKISPMTTEWKEGHQCLMKSWLYEYYGQCSVMKNCTDQLVLNHYLVDFDQI